MRGLSRLFRPRSVAVIGGGAWCVNVARECRKIGFGGEIWPVHPTRAEVGGLRAYASVDALPGAPDASFIGVNRRATIDVMAALAARGAGGAVAFASGFREADAELGDGALLQEALLTAAGDVALLGPNCYGFINAFDGVAIWPDQHGLTRVERGVAVVSQSSNIALNLTMQARGLPIGYLVTVGNQAQIGLSAAGRAVLDDPRVTALGLYVEGVDDLAAFEALAEAARARAKPIVALKVGASDQAQTAVASHTASLVGDAAGAAALFDRLGVGRVSSLSALLETLKLLHVAEPLKSARIASMSCSGGEACLIADTATRPRSDQAVAFPPLNARQETALRAALGPKVALANPLDYHTYIWADREALARCFSAMVDPELALVCVVLDFPREDRCDGRDWRVVIEAMADAHASGVTPMAVVSSLGETMPEAAAEAIIARGIAPLAGFDDALEAVAVSAAIAAAWRSPQPRALPAPPIVGEVETLSEAEAKRLLSRFDLDVPTAASAASPREAASAAGEVGFPVVLKGAGAAHKTEAGLVALNLRDAPAVERAATAMRAESFLIEDMVDGGVAELLVGVVRDPPHGFALTLGAGGVLAEVMRDTTVLLVPSAEADVSAALDRLRIAPVLQGYRGAPGVDRAAVVAAVLAAQQAVIALAETLVELEINPLICTPRRAVAADALIRVRAPSGETRHDR